MKKIAIALSMILLLLCCTCTALGELTRLPTFGLVLETPTADGYVYLEGQSDTAIDVIFYNKDAVAPYREAYLASANASPEDARAAEEAYDTQFNLHHQLLGSIVGFPTDQLGELADQLAGGTMIGANSTHTYYRFPGVENPGLAEEDKPLLAGCLAEAQRILDSFAVIEIEIKDAADAVGVLGTFSTTDMAGNPVDASIFAQADLTVLHVWATYCGPCIREMPLLAAWAKELPENVQVIGLIGDVPGPTAKTYQNAEKILSMSGAEFTNLLLCQELAPFMANITGVPTTFFLDRNGQLVGEPVNGAYLDMYKQRVADFLKQ